MWIKKRQTEPRKPSPAQGLPSPVAPVTFNATTPARPSSLAARTLACLGSNVEIKGDITGEEDLQIDGKVQGSISLQNHRLTVGRTAQLISEINAREVIVCGKVTGNLRARDLVEIKKDGSADGDIQTARISIEDGAHFKGRIEIEPAKSPAATELESVELTN